MSAGVEYVCGHLSRSERRIKSESDRHKGPRLAAERTGTALQRCVEAMHMPARGEHERSLFRLHVSVVNTGDVNGAAA